MLSLWILQEILLKKVLVNLKKKYKKWCHIHIWSNIKKVLAYIWNGWSAYKWDMIVRKRSVWSVLKPFIYFLALKNWASPESYILDDEKVYPTEYINKWFVPKNYIPKSYGPVKLREALWNSLNSATVRISEKIWLWKYMIFSGNWTGYGSWCWILLIWYFYRNSWIITWKCCTVISSTRWYKRTKKIYYCRNAHG